MPATMCALTPDEAEAITAEALRLNDRYVREVVEAFGVCPFARGARVGGRSERAVLLQPACDTAPVLAAIERFEGGRGEVEIVQLIFPRLRVTPQVFDDFVARVRAERGATPPRPPFVLASFHPDFGFDPRTPDTLVPFFRKTPHPTIQLVRLAVLDALASEARPRGTTNDMIARFLRGEVEPLPSVAAWITRENFARVEREGPAAINAVYASIARDRERGRQGS